MTVHGEETTQNRILKAPEQRVNSMTRLELVSCKLNQDALAVLFSSTPLLEILLVVVCGPVLFHPVLILTQSCRLLRRLGLQEQGHSGSLDDYVISEIATHLDRLEHFSIFSCGSIQGDGLKKLNSSRTLKSLALANHVLPSLVDAAAQVAKSRNGNTSVSIYTESDDFNIWDFWSSD